MSEVLIHYVHYNEKGLHKLSNLISSNLGRDEHKSYHRENDNCVWS